VLSRFGVGVAESGAAPVTLPLIADIFPPAQRSFAFGIFYIGPPLGGFLAAVAGGYIAAEHGWRAALLLAGLPGLILAILLFTTVREPTSREATAGEPAPRIGEVIRFLIGKPGLVCVMLGGATVGLIAITLGAWTGSFFIRVHGLDLKQVGLLLGVGGLLPTVATPAIGWLADRLALRDARWPLRLVWIGSLIGLVAGLVMLFSPMLWIAIAGVLVADLLRPSYAPLTNAVLITQAPARMRGSIISLVQLVTNLVGFGLGPIVIGLLSDIYGGGAAIKYALANGLVLYAVVFALIFTAGRFLYPQRTASAV
jgi:MFS family permease